MHISTLTQAIGSYFGEESLRHFLDGLDVEGVPTLAKGDDKEALRLYGEPSRTEADDDEIDWDQWGREGRQLRAN